MVLKRKQLNILHDQIVGNVPPTEKNKIFIYPIEAGVGKTTTTIKALLDLYEKDKNAKSIIVTKFTKEAARLEKALKGIGVAIHSKKEKPNRRTILEAPILIITHAKYIRLCEEDPNNMWALYSEGRSTLIIDEELAAFKTISINDSELFIARECFKMLDFLGLYWFDKLCEQLDEEVARYYKNPNNHDKSIKLKQCSQADIRRIDKVIKLIESMKSLEGCKEKIVIYNDMFMESYSVTYNDLIDIFQKLKIVLCAKSCIFNKCGFYTADEAFEYKLLDNNIVLDASASMIPIYKLSEKFSIVPAERIIDHNNWTINVCKLNTSASWKKRHPIFYDCVYLQAIKILNNNNNKLLIVGKKDEIIEFQRKRKEFCEKNKDRLSFTNFGDMRGKNDWADYNCSLIIHTPHLPSYCYPLYLKFHVKSQLFETIDLEMGFVGKNESKHYGFCNSKMLNHLRQALLAATVYQACKRIMRNDVSKANVYIITNNMRMIRTVSKHLKGANVKEFKLPNQSMIDKKKSRTYNRSEPSIYKIRLRKLFAELVSGEHKECECKHMRGHYKKRLCMMKIEYKGKNFGRFLNDMEEEMLKMGIDKNQHKIIVLKDA